MKEDRSGIQDNTEEKIRAVAKRLFTEKGYAGTTIREVVEEAGVNVALLNYYFRSKEKLFISIFAENFEEYSQELEAILSYKNISLEDRIRRFVNEVTEHLKKNPDLPLFLLIEFKQNNVSLQEKFKANKHKFRESGFVKQLQEEASKGHIRPIDPFQFEFMLNSMIAAPFLSLPALREVNQLEGEAFEHFLEERKKITADMIIAYLKDTGH